MATREPQSPNSPSAAASEATDRAATAATEETFSHGVAEIIVQLGEIRSQLARLAGVTWDRTLLRLREGSFRLLLYAWAALVVVTLSVAATLRFVAGLADALTVAFAGQRWAGNLVAGGLLLAAIWAAVLLLRSQTRRAHLKRTVLKYEARPDHASS